MAAQLTFFGHELTKPALLRGAAVNAIVVVIFGVIIGQWIDEGTWAGVFIAAVLMAGMFAGGFVAGRLARINHILHGFLSAVPTTAIALAVTIISVLRDRTSTSVLGLVATTVLAGSLGTLGGLIGSRFAPSRRSLLS